MSKIELTISPNYVPNWNYVDAVRELFQNALDQQSQNADNTASWQYDALNQTLTISNRTSKLTAASLLLGQTTKATDKITIGQFGEGYKIATLVLLREGKKVVFYNYGAKEIWRPRFVKSRRFGTDILTFFIEKSDSFWKKTPSADLMVVVENVSAEEYQDIVDSNLHLRTDFDIVEHTEYGDIISLPGKVFVNGLYVCDYKPYTYGYNFKPEHIRLDRDRKMVNDFDLCWMASKMWSACDDHDKVMEMVSEGKADVAFIKDITWNNDWCNNWCNIAAKRFYDVYGPEAIPVTSQEEMDSVPAGYKGIVVNSCYNDLIRSSALFVMPSVLSGTSPLQDLQEWFDSIKYKLDEADIERFNNILEELRNDDL